MVRILPQLPKGSITTGMKLLIPAAIIATVMLHQTGLVTTVSVSLSACHYCICQVVSLMSLYLSSCEQCKTSGKALISIRWLTHHVANAQTRDRQA